MLKLASCDSLQKIHRHMSSGVSDALACDVGSPVVTLTMTRPRLFLVNSSLMDSKQRAVFSWSVMTWFMSLTYFCITTKQNLVYEWVVLAFLLLRGDVYKPCNTTSDPAEHEFGNFWTKIWEFTTLEFSHITNTTERWSRMMFASCFLHRAIQINITELTPLSFMAAL